MSLYLFNKAHTGTTTFDLKISKNILLKLKCYLNVTKHPSAFINQWKTVELLVYKFGQQLFIQKSILMYELISFQ